MNPSLSIFSLALIRFLSYVGVSLNALVVPLVVWTSTADPRLVSVALFVEWIPKLYVYLRGGSWAARFGAALTHRFAESLRICALLVLACAAFFQIWWLAAVSASVLQVCNALCNICFETLCQPFGAKAHSRLSQATLAASLVVVPLAFLFSLWTLPLIGAAANLLALLLVLRLGRSSLYDHLTASEPASFFDGLRFLFADRRLLLLSLGGFLFGVPGAAVFSFLPAVFGWASPEWTSASFISSFTASASLCAITVLPFFSRSSSRLESSVYPLLVLSACAFSAPLLVPFPVALPFLLGFVCVMHAVFIVWSRQTRQSLLSPERRLHLTGVLISFEASSYLFGAALVSLAPVSSPVPFVLIASSLISLFAVIPLFLFRRMVATNRQANA